MTNKVSVPKARIFEFWNAIFMTQGFALVPQGEGKNASVMLKPVEQVRPSRAIAVPVEDLAKARGKPGTLIMTTIALKHIQVRTVRAAVKQLLGAPYIGVSRENAAVNALIVIADGPKVHEVNEILKAMDVPAGVSGLKFEQIKLEHAKAATLQPILRALYQPSATRAPRGDLRGGPSGAAPRITADSRTNTLAVFAVEGDLRDIKRVLTSLDAEIK